MKVRVSGLVWLPKAEMTVQQVLNLKSQLTIYPTKTTDIGNKSDPPPIFLFEETEEEIGIPRGYYQQTITKKHDEVLQLAKGMPMAPLKTIWTADGKFAEQGDVLKMFQHLMVGKSWGGFLLRAGCAFGKTATSLEFARRVGLRTLILVHQEFFLDQWKERIEYFMPDARVGIIRQKKMEFEEVDFAIGMLQSLAKDVDGTKYPKRMYDAFGMVINDECFIGNTIVKTVDGDKRIDEIESGNIVLNAVGVGMVTKVFNKLVPIETMRLITMSDGAEYLCTMDHPWLTANGWMPASDMTGSVALTNIDSIGIMLRHGTQENIDLSYLRDTQFGASGGEVLFSQMHRNIETERIPNVRTVHGGEGETGKESVLFEKLCCEMDKRESRRVFEESFGWCQEVAHGESPCSVGGVEEDDRGKSDAFGTCEEKAVKIFEGYRPQTAGSRRERIWVDGSSVDITGCVGETVGVGTGGSDRSSEGERREASKSLQIGRSESGIDGVHRGRREFSWCAESSSDGCKENSLSGGVRVESVKIPKSADFDRLRVSVEENRVRVFNLTVSGHPSYVLDRNIVVHNCHRVGAATWANIIPRFGAPWRLGLSATPKRKDGAQDVFFHHISQITYNAKTEAAIPKLRVLNTHTALKAISRGRYFVPTAKLNSAQVLTQLGEDEFRARDIVDQLVLAVKAGRKIMVVSERINHLKKMSDMLTNSLFNMDLPFQAKVDFYTGEWFTGGKWDTKTSSHRKGDLKTAKRSKEDLKKAESANVIFATKQMVAEGLDIQAIDVLVLAMPWSDVEQIVGRARRWCLAEPNKCKRLCPWRAGKCEEKPTPIIMDVIDQDIPQLVSKWNRRQAFYRKIGTLEKKGNEDGRSSKRQKCIPT